MAKSKKQEAGTEGQPSAGAKPKAGRKPPAKKNPADGASAASAPAARKAPKPAPAAPLVDTSLAAAAAAKLVANRERLQAADSRGGGGLIKQLKQSLSKPATTGPAEFLHNTSPTRKSNLPMGGGKQVGHNQTFGADVNRSGIPRRTGG